MYIKSFNSQYELIEYHHYVNHVDDKVVNLVELIIDCPIEKFVEDDFTSIFIIETDHQTHVFSWYEVSEYYEENGYLKVVLVKQSKEEASLRLVFFLCSDMYEI